MTRLPCSHLGRCLQNDLLVQQLHHHFHVALLGGQVQGIQPILEGAKGGRGALVTCWGSLGKPYSELLCRHDCRHLAHAGESPGWWEQEPLPCPQALRWHPAQQPWLAPCCQGNCMQLNAELLTNAGGFSMSKTYSPRRRFPTDGWHHSSVCVCLAPQALFQSSCS